MQHVQYATRSLSGEISQPETQPSRRFRDTHASHFFNRSTISSWFWRRRTPFTRVTRHPLATRPFARTRLARRTARHLESSAVFTVNLACKLLNFLDHGTFLLPWEPRQ